MEMTSVPLWGALEWHSEPMLESGSATLEYQIIDLSGRRVMSGVLTGIPDQLELGELLPGMYFFSAFDGKGGVAYGVEKVVVQR